MGQTKIVQTAGHDVLGEFAPEFAHLNDDILFGEVWSRNDLLGLRDRSVVTVTSLISQGITDNSLRYHLMEAKKNGISRVEISEIITHIAFMQVGLRRGLHLIWLRMFGQTIFKAMMPKSSSKSK